MGSAKEIIKDIEIEDVRLVINIAGGLIAAGTEILKLLEKDGKISNIDLLAIIEKQNDALLTAKEKHLLAIEARS